MHDENKKRVKEEGIELTVTDRMPPGYKDDSEQWESGDMGKNAQFVRKATREEETAIDNALGLAPISIRLQKQIVEELKALAALQGLGYQPYIRQLLTKHVSEAKQMASGPARAKR